MAADFKAIPLLVGLGLQSISLSAAAIPYAKSIIRDMNYSEVHELAASCLKCKTEKEIHQKADEYYNDHFGDKSSAFYNDQ